MNKNLLIGLGVFFAVVVVGFFLVGKSKTGTTTSMPVPATGNSNVQEKVVTTVGEVREIKISAKEFAYTPSTITVNKGEKVRITLTNDGTTSHNLSIQGLGVSTKTIAPGESDSVDFTPATTGSFTFFCTIDSHKDLGLTGTLEVK